MMANLSSPRLARLQFELEQGDASALERFWQAIEQQGAPLIEPVEDDPTQMLVSFLWRDPGDTRQVAVVGGPADPEKSYENQMQRLLSTNLWYKTYQVPSDLRTTYKFFLDDIDISCHEEQELLKYALLSHVDPLNPRQVAAPLVQPGSNRRVYVSLLELPFAPAQPWITPQPHVPRGKLKLFMLKSRILQNNYHLAMYTPHDYKTEGRPYKLLLLFDSWMYMDAIPVPTIMDNLRHAGTIDPYVVVMYSHLDYATRNRDLSCYRPFTDFLARELLPWLHQHYHISRDPADCIVGGVSLGGVAAAFAGFMHPDLFGSIISQSGAFGSITPTLQGEWLIQQFARSPKLPLRFSLEVGSLERGTNFDHLTANLHLREVLLVKGYEVHFAEFHGGHDIICWRGSFAERLLDFQGRCEAVSTSSNPILDGL